MSTRPDDQGPDQAVPLLRDLGLTCTEAEVYCAALQSCATEPVSSYKLAQGMGRDPANVAKILGALVRLDAMTIVQDKPRLYLPAEPEAFAAQVLRRVEAQGRQAVDLLNRFHAQRPAGMTLGLAEPELVFAQARELLAGCRQRALVFGSKESLREIGAELEELAADGTREVQVLSPVDMVSDRVEISVFSKDSDLAGLQDQEFLQIVVDDRAWLSSVLEPAATPCGWWSDDSPIAQVLAAGLSLARRTVSAESPLPAPALEPEAAPPAEPEAAAPPAPDPVPEPVPEPQPEPEPDVEDIVFLMRHADEKD